jgi:primosomal protein N' (replication factor Y)
MGQDQRLVRSRVSDTPGTIAQVVPDLPTFAVDDGFAYRVPEDLIGLELGSIVRIPLGSRRVRGYVASIRKGETSSLKPVISVSGDQPIFGDALLQTLRWAALHYVAPLSVLLARAAPPNLPRGKGRAPKSAVPGLTSPLPEVSESAASGARVRPTCYISAGPYASVVAQLANAPLHSERNVAVVAPTVDEANALADRLREVYGDRVIYVSSALAAKDATKAWVRAMRHSGLLVVGTPEIALWPLGAPAMWIVVEEGRRAMKSKQTPTLQVRDLVRRRALVERTSVVFLGPVPTLDTLAKGAAVVEPPGRVWPLVELIDRREDSPGGRSLSSRTVHAIRQVVKRGGQVFVFVSRRGYAPAFRCVRCRELRRCPECGSGPDRGDRCKRCGASLGPCTECGGRRFEPLGAGMGRVAEEIQKQIGEDRVGGVGSGRQVIVGSERDLPYVPETALTVAVDADSLLMAPNYRAEDDAIRLLVRVAATVARGTGRRCLVQTGQPQHRGLDALRSGHPIEFLNALNRERERDHLPPAASLIAIEVVGDTTAQSDDLEVLVSDTVQVHGPETGGGRTRWFVQGDSIHGSRIQLRSIVQRWRDANLKVRIDADPIDL